MMENPDQNSDYALRAIQEPSILTLSCLLFSACGKDEIPQEENEKKTEETTFRCIGESK